MIYFLSILNIEFVIKLCIYRSQIRRFYQWIQKFWKKRK